MCANACNEKTPEVQTAVFLHCIGEEARVILETFEMTEAQRKDVKQIKQKFDDFFLPKKNVSVEIHKFNMRVQLPDESFDSFVKDWRQIVVNYEFITLRDELIKDRIVCGIYDHKVKDRLLRKPNLDLNKAIFLKLPK